MYRKKKVSGLSFVSDKSQMADDYWVDQSDQNVQAKWNKIKEISNYFQILTENKLKHLVRPVQLRQQFYNNRLADLSTRKRLEKAFMKIIEDGSEFSFAKQRLKLEGITGPMFWTLKYPDQNLLLVKIFSVIYLKNDVAKMNLQQTHNHIFDIKSLATSWK